jgi:SAM-dependent methyltransferase
MDAELERRTLAAEDAHWWYRGRRAIVLDSAHRLLGADGASPGALRILDAGCGGGRVLSDLSGLGDAIGLEPSETSRAKALSRGAAEVVDGTLEGLPFDDDSFELATCLDVLEHTDDDRPALRELHRVVRSGGGLVVTVPAHPRLWSRHDDLNHHRRRYTRTSLAAAATETGWRVERLTHFNAILLPVALVARRFDRSDGLDIPPAPINRALEATLQLERLAIRAGLRLPVGLSLLAELRR